MPLEFTFRIHLMTISRDASRVDRREKQWHHYLNNIFTFGGARGVVVIAIGNEHGDTSSNPGRYWLHFT